jgi:hypothetical protein
VTRRVRRPPWYDSWANVIPDAGPWSDAHRREARTVEYMTTNFPPRDLRVSDADRDRAVSELSEQFQAGRLTSEEFDERSGQALQARTGSDLEVLFADLPRPETPKMPPPPVNPGPAAPRFFRPMLLAPVAIVLALLAAALLSGHHGTHFTGSFVPVIFVLVVILRLVGGGRRRGGRRGPW